VATQKEEGLMGVSDLQKSLPGPMRLLREPAADNSGGVNADPQLMADAWQLLAT
jgi:hypothetical protein